MKPKYFLVLYSERTNEIDFQPVYQDEDGYIAPVKPHGKVLGAVPA